MSDISKYYPVQGVNKFQTVSFPITKAFSIDYGAQTTANATVACYTVPKGSVVLGFAVRITETLASTSAATIQFGFTGTQMLTTATASGVAVAGYIATPTSTAACVPLMLSSDDTFDCILATDPPSAGKAEVFLTYIPMPNGSLSTSEFLSIVCT